VCSYIQRTRINLCSIIGFI